MNIYIRTKLNRWRPVPTAFTALLVMTLGYSSVRADGYPPVVIGPQPTLNWASTSGPPIIAIRYLAFSGEQARPTLERVTDADRTIASTNYYVAVLRQRLIEQIPQARILLDPATIVLSPTGKLVWSTSSEHPSVDVLVEFVAYVPNQNYSYYADEFVPVVSILVAPRLAPEPRGQVSTDVYCIGLNSSVDGSFSPYDALGTGCLEAFGGGGMRSVFGKGYSTRRPWTGEKPVLLGVPFEVVKRDKANKNVDVLPKDLDIYGYLIVDALNVISARNPIASVDPQFAAYYDAKLITDAALSEDYARKVKRLFAIRQAEATFLNAKSEAISKGLLNGEFGDSFRATRDSQAGTRHKSWALGILTLGTMTAGVSNQIATHSATNATTLNAATNLEQGTNSLANALSAAIAPAVKLQVDVAVQIDEESQNISASELRELREKLKGIYQNRFPTIR
jgi:hypothetical protein